MPEIHKTDNEDQLEYHIQYESGGAAVLHPSSRPFGRLDELSLENIAKKLNIEPSELIKRLADGETLKY